MVHVKVEDIDLALLKIGKNGRTIVLLYDGSPLQIITDRLYSPFGVKGYTNDYSRHTNWVIDCSLPGEDKVEPYDKLQVRVMELIKEKEELFKDIDLDGDYLAPIFRDNKTYPRLMKMNIPRDTKGNLLSVYFDENGDKHKIVDNNIEELLRNGSKFRSIIECGKIWVYKGRVGVTWNNIQIRATKVVSNSNQESSDNTNAITKNIMLPE